MPHQAHKFTGDILETSLGATTILKSSRPPFGKGYKLRMALRIMIKIVDIPIQEQKREGSVHSTSWLSRVMLLVSSNASSINKYLQHYR